MNDVSVVIASYNQLGTLPITLHSLARQSVWPKQVLVADDGSWDGTIEWLDSQPEWAYPFKLRYTTGRHDLYGLTISENRAASFLDTGRVIFTNADMILNAGSVAEHAKIAPNAVGGGRVREIQMPESTEMNPDKLLPFTTFDERVSDKLTGSNNDEYFLYQPWEANNICGVWGGNFSISALRFHSIGGFNEDYKGKYGGEEADLIQRFMKRGGYVEWVYNSIGYHLQHHGKIYRSQGAGIVKYKQEYMSA